jgi:site-specific DNA recombinase
MRVAVYARVSTDEQAEKFGLSAQLTELRAFAAKRGWEIPAGAEFVDDGYSGAELDRPALARLREAVRLRAFDAILVHDVDRLARRLAHQLLLVEEFERARVRVDFLLTPRADTPEGRLLEHVKGVIAEYERAKIVERTQRGKREKARQGLIVASYPYGYTPDPAAPGRLLIEEAEAGVVRLVYRLLIDEQRSVRAIIEELRRLGVPPRRSGSWAPTSVRRLLNSEVYTGRAYYNRDQVIPGTKERRVRPRNEWIAVPIPAIVTPERFSAAQAQLERNRVELVGRPTPFVYLLRGLLRCVVCGSRYDGCPSHGRRYYRCHGRDRLVLERPCRAPWLSARVAEAVVWDAVAGVLRRPKVLLRALDGYATRQGVRDVEVRSSVEHVRRQLADLERQERRLLDLYLDDSLRTEAVRTRLEELARRRAGLREQLERAEGQAAALGAAGARHDMIVNWCAQARRGLNRLDLPGRQRLLRALIDEIRVLPDRHLEIHGILPSRTPAQELCQPA